MEDAFYVPEADGRYRSTEWTRGPWDPDAQHASPPAALLGRAIERCQARPDTQVARVTYEILRPVPIGVLEIATDVVRGGRRVELVEATMHCAGSEVMRARAWRLRTTDLGVAVGVDRPPPDPPGELDEPWEFFPTGYDVGYHTAMDGWFLRGGFLEQGPAVVWMRMGVPLVAGEEPTPLQRVLAVADCGNGVSAVLDYHRYVFINTDLSVFLHRPPAGEWVCLDARTLVEPTGPGLAESVLYDERGPIGRALQTLFIAER